MVGQSKFEGTSARFGAYVEELREFFRSRDVRFGSPADLVAFAARVSQPGPFQEEMGSMVRSILFQENDSLGRGELLDLLTVAAGGGAVETGAEDPHASVRQIFTFVNGALRQRNRMFSGQLGADEEHVTAGDVLAAATARDTMGGHTVGRSPENGQYGRHASAARGAGAEAAEERIAGTEEPVGSGMLFRAVSMSDADAADASMREWQRSRRRWMVPAVAAAVIALGAGAYFLRPLLLPVGRHTTSPTGLALGSSTATGSACAGPMAPGTSRTALEERSRWAHRLLDQKLYDAALPELKSVAQMDPGFPGVNLDESEALLHLKRSDDAREAVDTQISISECMAKLPSPALDTYCSAEFSPAAAGACRPELARIRQAAQLQAAMVHLELGHQISPDAGAVASESPKELAPEPATVARAPASPDSGRSPARARRASSFPPATEGDADRPAQQRLAAARSPTARSSRKAEGDESLMKGEGTDSSLGAYSKPQ